MNVNVKKLAKSEIELEVEISAKEFDKFFEQAVLEAGKDLEAPGFRKGKAPKNVIEEKIGRQNIMADAADLALKDSYKRAILENKLEPISEPKIEILKLAPGNPFIFRAKAIILPDIDLSDYKKIISKIKKREVKVKDREIEDTLKWLQKSKPGKDDKAPEINDEFAKSLGNFENLNKLKESIKSGLVMEKEQAERQRIRNEILDKMGEAVNFDIPEVLIEREKKSIKESFEKQILQGLKMPVQDYLKKINKTEKEISDSFKEQAGKRIKSFLILRAVAKKENIEVSEEEVRNQANEILKHYPGPEEASKDIDFERLKNYSRELIMNEKIFKLLEDSIKSY